MGLMGGQYFPPTFNSISSGPWANLSWDSTYSFRREQTRFQEKELREKEEKLLKLYEEQQNRALRSVGSRRGGSWMPCDLFVGPGKVRYLFQSRRRAGEANKVNPIAGRDKSFPLQPLTKHHFGRSQTFTERTSHWNSYQEPSLHQRSFSLDRYDSYGRNKGSHSVGDTQCLNRGVAEDRSTATYGIANRFGEKDSVRRSLRESDVTRFEIRETRYGEPDDCALDRRQTLLTHPLIHNPIVEKMESKFRNFAARSVVGRTSQATSLARTDTLSKQPSKEVNSSASTIGSASSPVRKIRKATPAPLSVAPPPIFQRRANKTFGTEARREAVSPVSPASSAKLRTRTSADLPPSKASPPTVKATHRPTSSKLSTTLTTVADSSLPSNLVNCRFCTRHFAADRISKHELICQKSKKNNRKPFDALQQRVKGTEAEKYVKKSTKMSRGQAEEVKKPKNDWRKKHEEFIRNIRAAKEVSIHLKNGGKLSELPPPPPSDYSDYVQCPHCTRKFNEAAAERHIPKCANIINNKPKPQQRSATAAKSKPAVRGRK